MLHLKTLRFQIYDLVDKSENFALLRFIKKNKQLQYLCTRYTESMSICIFFGDYVNLFGQLMHVNRKLKFCLSVNVLSAKKLISSHVVSRSFPS